jgi:hypothetical protein
LAKEPTVEGEGVTPPRARRKPLTIDLPAEEIGKKAVEGGAPPEAAQEAGSAAAAAFAGAVETPRADPVIPSAFAKPAAEREGAPRPPERDVPPKAEERDMQPRARPAAEERPRSFAPFLLAAFAGGAVAAIAIIGLALAGYFSSARDGAEVAAAIAALESEVASLRQAGDGVAALKEQVAALETSLAELAGRPAASAIDATALTDLTDRIVTLETAGGASGSAVNLEPRLNQLASEVATLKSAAPADTAAIETALAELREELAALSARVDSAPGEERVAALETKLDETSRRIEAAAALAPAVAADALAAALDSGRPFQNELAALKSLGIAAALVDGLAPQAETGLPTIADLRSGFEAAIAPIVLATPIPEETGTIDRLLQSARGLVDVRPAHPTAGGDPAAIVARIRAALAADYLKTALAEWNTLPDTIKAPTQAWAESAEARLKADALVAEVRAAALAWLAAGR